MLKLLLCNMQEFLQPQMTWIFLYSVFSFYYMLHLLILSCSLSVIHFSICCYPYAQILELLHVPQINTSIDFNWSFRNDFLFSFYHHLLSFYLSNRGLFIHFLKPLYLEFSVVPSDM